MLKITLKPSEKIIVAGAVITNAGSTAHLLIGNKVPILREKDILKEENADSPARRIYYIVQLMYLDQEGLSAYHTPYWKLVGDFLKAAPSAMGLINRINERIISAQYYAALKLADELIEYEQFLISGAPAS